MSWRKWLALLLAGVLIACPPLAAVIGAQARERVIAELDDDEYVWAHHPAFLGVGARV